MLADPWENSENKNEYNNNSYITLEIENVETESGLINNELQNGEEKIHKQMRKPLLITTCRIGTDMGKKSSELRDGLKTSSRDRASSSHRLC